MEGREASGEPSGPWLVRRVGELERGRASGLAPGKRQQASAVQSLRRASSERGGGGLVGRGPSWRSAGSLEGLVWMGAGGVGTGILSRWWRKRDRRIPAESATVAVGVDVEGRAARDRRREECGLNMDPEPAKAYVTKATENARASINSTRSRTILSRSGFVQHNGCRRRLVWHLSCHRRFPLAVG